MASILRNQKPEIMATTLNLSLTDELKKFIQENSGEGTLYNTPSEYVRDLIRNDLERKKAAEIRAKILDGYRDAIDGNTLPFSGNLKADLKKHRSSTNG